MSEVIEVKQSENKGFWAILREAIAGSQRDFTQGSVGLAIFLLAVPMILEMMMESIFAIVDIFFVGKLGADAVAVVGFTESMMALVYAVAIGLSVGATATVARRIGEKDADGAARAAVHVIYLGIIVSVAMGVVGIVFAADFLRLLGATEEVVRLGTPFTQIMLGGNAVVVFLFLLNAIFRGAGDAAIAMRVLWIANVINIVLGPCFIFGWLFFPRLGVTGAAVATTIGRGAGALIALWFLLRSGGRITIERRHLPIDFALLWQLVKLSSSAVLQFTIATASWTALVRIASPFGSEAVAGYVIAMRVIMFALLPSVGLSNAAATLVGQNLGAGKPERSEQAVWKAAFYNAVFLGLVGLVLVFLARPIAGLFAEDATVLNYAADGLRIISYGFVFYALGMVLETAFNGAGDTWTPTYLNLFIFWIFEIPLAYLLAHQLGFGMDGIYWAVTVAFSALAVASAVLFRRGKWKTKVV